MVPVLENFGPGKIWSRKKITRTGKNWSRIKVPVSVPEKIGSKIKYPKKLVPVKSTGTGNGKIWGTVTLYNFYLATPERGKRKRKEERGKRKRKEEIERGKRKRKEKEERERAKRKRKE